MKFPVAYYLVLLYVTVIFRPFIPLVSDAWGHVFGEAEHVATVHAKYGANHAEKELAADSKAENDNTKDNNTGKGQEPVPVHLLQQQHACETGAFVLTKSYQSYTCNIPPDVCINLSTPPPDVEFS